MIKLTSPEGIPFFSAIDDIININTGTINGLTGQVRMTVISYRGSMSTLVCTESTEEVCRLIQDTYLPKKANINSVVKFPDDSNI